MTRPRENGPETWGPARVQEVGRGSAWVLDPFEDHRHYLEEDAAAWIDHQATLRGEEIAGLTDDELARRTAELSPFARFDRPRATRALEWHRRLLDGQVHVRRAQEDALMLEARASEQPQRQGRAADLAAQRQHLESLERAVVRLNDNARALGDSHYLRSWTVEHESAVIEHVALTRERAIREQETLHAPSPTQRREPDPLFGLSLYVPELVDSAPARTRRSIGVGEDVALVVEELRETSRYWNEIEPATNARIISRDELTVTDPFDRLVRALGQKRSDAIAERTRPRGRSRRAAASPRQARAPHGHPSRPHAGPRP